MGLHDLIERIACGEIAAFKELFGAGVERITLVAFQSVRDWVYAEEIAQETLLEVWRCAARFDPKKGSAMAWVSTIARRRAVDRVRAEQSARRRDQASGEQNPVCTPDVADEVTDRVVRRRAVDHALTCLTPLQREAIVLAFYGGLTYPEVAAVLDATPSTVRTRIRDGLHGCARSRMAPCWQVEWRSSGPSAGLRVRA